MTQYSSGREGENVWIQNSVQIHGKEYLFHSSPGFSWGFFGSSSRGLSPLLGKTLLDVSPIHLRCELEMEQAYRMSASTMWWKTLDEALDAYRVFLDSIGIDIGRLDLLYFHASKELNLEVLNNIAY